MRISTWLQGAPLSGRPELDDWLQGAPFKKSDAVVRVRLQAGLVTVTGGRLVVRFPQPVSVEGPGTNSGVWPSRRAKLPFWPDPRRARVRLRAGRVAVSGGDLAATLTDTREPDRPAEFRPPRRPWRRREREAALLGVGASSKDRDAKALEALGV